MRYFHTALSVANIETSQKFYQTVFGLKFRVAAERRELKVRFINLEDEYGIVVELFEHDAPKPLSSDLMDFQHVGIKHISFIVPNLEAAIALALDNNAKLIRQPKAGLTVKRNAFIADPDGIPIELVELDNVAN